MTRGPAGIGSVMSAHRRTRVAQLNDTTDTVVAMALLWVIPVFAFVYTLTRL